MGPAEACVDRLTKCGVSCQGRTFHLMDRCGGVAILSLRWEGSVPCDPCFPGPLSLVGCEGSTQPHRPTKAQDNRNSRAQWPGRGHSSGKSGEVGQGDGRESAGLKLRAYEGRSRREQDCGAACVEVCRVGSLLGVP